MKALVYTNPCEVTYQTTDDPVPGNDEVIVHVEAVGICGSDMHAFRGHDDRRPPPLILGHEAMGVVEGGALDGERAVVNPLVTCGTCDACVSGRTNVCRQREIISIAPRQGAFAEMVAIPERNLITVPDNLSAAQAALAEPLATGWHAVAVAAKTSWTPLEACGALVIGGGAIGMSAALALRARGCNNILIAETNPLRCEAVARAKIGDVFNPIRGGVVDESAVDLVVDCVGGGKTRELASMAVSPGGAIVHVGLQDSGEGLDVRKMTLQEVTLVGTYTYTMTDFEETVTAMAAGDLGPLDWFDERPLAKGAEAFADLMGGRAAAAKIILRPEPKA